MRKLHTSIKKEQQKNEMKNEENKWLNYFGLILMSILIISCQSKSQEKEGCSKYVNENYLEQTTDTSLKKEAFEYQEILLERFGESSVKGLNYEAYHLQFYSSHGYGKSVKFERKVGGCSISVKCISKKEWFEECKEYQIGIDEDEWNELVKIIYEFNFWTAEDFRGNKDVLDGYAFFLAGNRPEAEKCNKKSYKLVGRGSPRYDKMEALCENILEYEDQIKFKYEQLDEIK
jgi:hypothetical protein